MARVFKLTDTAPQTGDYQLDYEALLNKQQLEAVKTFSGPVLCIAGAGSGKTRTLIYRVARMIESGIAPESILLLTFTRKAARNMLNRVAALVGEEGRRVSGGTYHSFASITLRQYGHYLGLPANFSIIDESDCADIINLIRADLGLNKKETRFPQKKTLLDIFSKSVNREQTIEEIIESDYSHFSEHSKDIVVILERFRSYKKDNYLVDYDDLLVFLLRLLQESEEARARINQRFKYIMADEYQDTNGLQARITMLLGGNKKNIMVVGDDSQSIYSFRGARVRNIIEFPQQFDDCQIIKLERNYRSTSRILEAANSLMQHADEGFKKHLFTRREEGEKPAVVCCQDDQEQAMFVAARILELREQGVSLNDMAVLFRSSFHAYQLELELKRRNIPYVKWGGFKFLESGHLKDIIAHMRVVQNPYDQVSWLRILLLLEGIGTQTATEIFRKIKESDNPFELNEIKARPRAKEGLKRLSETLKNAAQLINEKPSRLLDLFAEYYFPILKKRFDDYPKRMKDIDALAMICQRFGDLSEFLSEIALEPPKDSSDNNMIVDSDDDEQLILSTIHSAKGLEWHSVFIIHALEGRFPSFNAFKSEEQLEEERRLMYVAMTRACENLAISYPGTMWDPVSGALLAKPSRFIDESGNDNLETWHISR
ncbi:MAG: ATP-dependent helicase UvrD/PcrA [Clostridiales bacterium]|jgi:DNA helicase-2/ATP-dependent DNA helicase PcrA|nr:ATP-dependent helicase UvrD/PcrA [Clostridiales bacterium]MDN5282094.1 ATP-dependent helicase UvrD/PcrA [Candidatus Ozemobacter sp.]